MWLKPIECLSKFIVTLFQLINHVGNGFDVSRMEISALKISSGQPKKYEDKELEALLEEDQSQTQEELAKSLGITQQAVSVRLKTMGMIQKQGNWMPYELKPRDIERRFFTCEQLIQRQQRKSFLHRIMIGDEKWIFYDNLKKKKYYAKPGQSLPLTSTSKRPNIHGSKIMLCI